MKTLVYHTGGLGDFCAILPAISSWKKHEPSGTITLFGKPSFGELGREFGIIDETYDITSRRAHVLFSDKVVTEYDQMLKTFSAGIVFAGDDSPIVARLNRLSIPAYHHPPFPPPAVHCIDYHLSLFGAVDPAEAAPFYPVKHSERSDNRAGNGGKRRTVMMCPGSGSSRKNWLFERFLSCADILSRNGFEILWVAGPAEEGLRLPGPSLRTPPLPELARALAGASVYIGNDSGVTHLAALVGCPTVALFGPSDPRRWAPRGRSVVIVNRPFDCAPCHGMELPASCTFDCMENISVDEVITAAMAIHRQG